MNEPLPLPPSGLPAELYAKYVRLLRIDMMLTEDTWWGKQRYVSVVLCVGVIFCSAIGWQTLSYSILGAQICFVAVMIGRRSYLLRKCGKLLQRLEQPD